jgi:hypothetical protein
MVIIHMHISIPQQQIQMWQLASQLHGLFPRMVELYIHVPPQAFIVLNYIIKYNG